MAHSYKNLLTILILAITPMPITTWASQPNDGSERLKSYTTCKIGGDLDIKDITRRAKSGGKYREVITDKGTERVSVVDGYRVMFAFKGVPYYYANIKIELSEAQSYAQDKGKVISNLKHFSSTKQATKIIYTDKTLMNGFEHYGIDRDVIDVGNTLGTHVFFKDDSYLIITIYFLNQGKENRRFNNIEEYRTLKDNFLNQYTECLKG